MKVTQKKKWNMVPLPHLSPTQPTSWTMAKRAQSQSHPARRSSTIPHTPQSITSSFSFFFTLGLTIIVFVTTFSFCSGMFTTIVGPCTLTSCLCSTSTCSVFGSSDSIPTNDFTSSIKTPPNVVSTIPTPAIILFFICFFIFFLYFFFIWFSIKRIFSCFLLIFPYLKIKIIGAFVFIWINFI